MKNIFKKKKKLPNLEAIVNKRSIFVAFHNFTMIGREIKYTTPEIEDSSGHGVVLSDSLDLDAGKRIYTVLENNKKTIKVPDSMVYQCSGIDENRSIGNYNPEEMGSDINQYCNKTCIMICQEECPLYKYKIKKI